MAISARRKRAWFESGAASFTRVSARAPERPTYPCPICLKHLHEDALADGTLTAEHVPLKSLGGRELVLTCKKCNNESGTKLDADAFEKEMVRAAMAGHAERVERVRAKIGGFAIWADLHASGGQYSLKVEPRRNRPGTKDALGDVGHAGASLTLQFQPFAELGAKISWLRSGYLALFAVAGYGVALDSAMQIVRRQILECDERRMVTFTSEAPYEIPLSERRLLRVLAPTWHGGWAVQFGRYFVHFPAPGDMDFYERLATRGGSDGRSYDTTYQNLGWPTEPTFGTPRIASLA